MTRAESKKIKKARIRRIKRMVAKFKEIVRTEEDAISFILELYRDSGGFQCTCGNVLSQSFNTRMTKCGDCKRDCWVTAGTMFDHAHRLVPYLTAVFLRTNGVEMQKGELGDVVRVSASTAGEILKKISMVVVDQMTGDFQEFSSAAFLQVYSRRSRATPAFAHPRAEEEVFELQRESAPIATSEIAAPELEPQHAQVYELIPEEEGITFDQLLDQTGMSIQLLSESVVHLEALSGLIRLIPGGRYIRREIAQARQNRSTPIGHPSEAGLFIDYVETLHGACSRKYVQLYAADFWCSKEPERWKNKGLFHACLRSKKKRSEDIVTYVSPAYIKVSPTNLTAA
ncbi:MAG: hypothetical protein K2X93_26560 [Candidatus Obscuribacterales bacterium]|nr:hypothetical protein [Candidatus Obscuribacterales bacterium]